MISIYSSVIFEHIWCIVFGTLLSYGVSNYGKATVAGMDPRPVWIDPNA